MPDQTLVGWLPPEAWKKNRHRQIFCPLRPIWALIIMQVQLYTTWYSKAHRKREWRVKYITNITPNWSPCGLCLRPAPLCVFYLTKGKGARGSPKIDQGCSIGCPIPIVAISTSRASEVGQSSSSSVTSSTQAFWLFSGCPRFWSLDWTAFPCRMGEFRLVFPTWSVIFHLLMCHVLDYISGKIFGPKICHLFFHLFWTWNSDLRL